MRIIYEDDFKEDPFGRVMNNYGSYPKNKKRNDLVSLSNKTATSGGSRWMKKSSSKKLFL